MTANPQAKILFVAGMHRSGTSVISRQLVLSGGIAPGDLLPAAEDNPRGFYESRTVVAINEQLLELFGSSWRDPSPLPAQWLERVEGSELPARIREFLHTSIQGGGTLILKDPRFCRTLALWVTICKELEVEFAAVVVRRDPVAVARSLWNRNYIPSGHSLQLWCRYYLDLCRLLADIPHGIVDFEQYCDHPDILRSRIPVGDGFQESLQMSSSAVDETLLNNQYSSAESRQEKNLQTYYVRVCSGAGFSEQVLRHHYRQLGGDEAARERRHYGVVAMILDRVIEEKNELLAARGQEEGE